MAGRRKASFSEEEQSFVLEVLNEIAEPPDLDKEWNMTVKQGYLFGE